MTKVTTILFDLDGTLVDNFEAIYASYRHTLEKMRLPPTDFDTVRRTVGGSVPITMRRLLKENFREEAVELFRAHFTEHFAFGLRLLPGAGELIRSLDRIGGYRQAVFTNKHHEMSRKVCRHLGIDRYLVAIEGSERPNGFRKPNPDFSRHMLEQVGAEPADTVMIGDSPFDAEAARVVDIPHVYLVATGSHTAEELRRETDATCIYPDLPTLAREVFSLDLEPATET